MALARSRSSDRSTCIRLLYLPVSAREPCSACQCRPPLARRPLRRAPRAPASPRPPSPAAPLFAAPRRCPASRRRRAGCAAVADTPFAHSRPKQARAVRAAAPRADSQFDTEEVVKTLAEKARAQRARKPLSAPSPPPSAVGGDREQDERAAVCRRRGRRRLGLRHRRLLRQRGSGGTSLRHVAPPCPARRANPPFSSCRS